jgi:hypothetical protein
MTAFADMAVDVHTALRYVDASDTTQPQPLNTLNLIEDACWQIEHASSVIGSSEEVDLAWKCYQTLKQVFEFGPLGVVSAECLDCVSNVLTELERFFELSPFPDQNYGRYLGTRPTRFEHILEDLE